MSRHKERQQAFIFLFQSLFTDEDIEDIVESSKMSEDTKISDFAIEIFNGVRKNMEKIDFYIENNAKGWKINRLSKVTLCILRICIYEMLYDNNIPAEVSINEAVELAKKYGTDDEPSYINGVLGSVYKNIKSDQEKTEEI